MQNKIKITILILLVFTYIITNFSLFGGKNQEVKVNIKDRIPLMIDGYEGNEIEIPEKLFKIIHPDEIIMRTYKKGEAQINIAVVVSDDRDDLHAPEVCYKLQGFKFNEEEKVNINNGCAISRVLATREDKPYVFHFWYTDMNVVYKDRFDFMKHMVFDKLLDRKKKYALVIAYTDASNLENLKAYSIELNKYILNQGNK